MKNKHSYHYGLSFYALILALFCQSSYLPAQSQQPTIIKGITSDASGPLAGVTILIKNTTTGTSSDFDGLYSITAKPNDTLVFSYIGYKTQEVPIQGRNQINTTLQPDTQNLNEVVINAGYYTVTDRERTGSIARITAKEIETQPVTNVLATLQGRMSGVNITQTTGVPGGGFDIRIRGINSLRANANAPLYIVNGIPFNSQSLGFNQTSQAILGGTVSPLNVINPDNISSIEILKDADATAIYGSRGSNGVVLITTKNGSEGKPQFQINTLTGVSQYNRPMKLLNTSQFQQIRTQAFANDNITNYPVNAYDLNGTWDANRYTDWQEELLGNSAILKQTSVSVSGGSELSKYMLSTTMRKENTVFPGASSYNKLATTASASHLSPNKKFQIQYSANYMVERNSLPGQDLTSQALNLAPNAPALYDEEGNLNWENGTFTNPLSVLEGTYQFKNKSLITSANFLYHFNPKWSANINMGYNEYHIDESKTAPHTMFNPGFGPTSAASNLIINWGERNSWLIEPQLTGNIHVANLKIEALIGSTLQYEQLSQNSMIGVGFASNNLINNIQAANLVTIPNQLYSEYRYAAIYSRINFNLKNTYVLNLTGRRDGSSRFGASNKYANFGAIGAAWIISNEGFLKNNQILSFAKLRASYGTSGSDQIGDYQYLDTYQTTNNNYGGILGVEPTRLANPNFGWETNKKFEVAMETTWLNDNIGINLSHFINRSSNQLVGTPLPATTGFSTIQENLNAVVENKGTELELQIKPFDTQTFKWNIAANISWLKNKLVSFDGLESSTYANTFEVGKSINILKLYNSLGVNPETGIYHFQDADGNGAISGFGDRTFTANLDPTYFGGLHNQIQYKNWQLDVHFQFVKQQGRNYRFSQVTPGTLANLPSYYFDTTWTSENTANVPHQALTSGTNPAAFLGNALQSLSNESISDASYARLKNVQIAYTLPQLKDLNIKLYLQGQNLLTITNYKGLDPETRAFNVLPPLRQWALGTQIQF